MTAASASYLAIDLGASSGRAVVGTLDGARMRMTEVHRFRTPLVEDDGHLYWDAEALWAEARTGLARALEAAPTLRSVSVDSWAVDYVPLGADGVALRRPYAYRDTRTTGRMARVLDRVRPDALYAMTGVQFLPFNTLPQVVADLEDEPATVARTATRLLIADWLLYRLSGAMVAERTMASTTQLYDVRAGTWAGPLLHAVGDAPSRWPQLVDPGTPLGRVRPDALPPARRDAGGAAPQVIATCSHDTAAAVAAVPADGDEAWAYISSGTWSLVGAELTAPVLTPAARAAGFTNEVGLDDTIRFLKNRTGTWVLEECAREWADAGTPVGWDELQAEALAAGSMGFVVDCNAPPFAERGDMLAKVADACRAVGAPAPAGRGALVRLVLESLADSYRRTLDELESLTGQDVRVLHVVGGGSRNALLNQLTADVCGRRVLAGPDEATALGNLLVQARTLGDLPPGVGVREAARHSSTLTEYAPRHAASHATPVSPALRLPTDTPR